MTNNSSIAFEVKVFEDPSINGREPILGGKLRTKAVWVDESTCIGCTYCNSVATNTFAMESIMGRARAFRQDGDTTEVIQEAIDTCPVNCIHWVKFEELDDLRAKLEENGVHPLGMLPKISRRVQPSSN
ncbi:MULTISPECIES: ferredoxin [Prochlorococcus]|uniref:ferredoxin n=1 Tax=Prochlorococcus TaxID=1218 RepID=UPI000533815F|nr:MULTISPECIES: ferredoxin [Prochlorococcus]KGG13505.1 Ferredoxin [Prochlorococcus sp. MIT 0601]